MLKNEDIENIEYLTNLLTIINNKEKTKEILINVLDDVNISNKDFFTKFYTAETRILYFVLVNYFNELNLDIKITNMFYMTGSTEKIQRSIFLKSNNYITNMFRKNLFSKMLNNTEFSLFLLSLFIIELEYKNKIYLFHILKYKDTLIVLSINRYPFSLFYWTDEKDLKNSASFTFNTIHDKVLKEIIYSKEFHNYISDNFLNIINNNNDMFKELSFLTSKETLSIRHRPERMTYAYYEKECISKIDIKAYTEIKQIIAYIKKSYLIDNKTILLRFFPVRNKDADIKNIVYDSNIKESCNNIIEKNAVRYIVVEDNSQLYQFIHNKTKEYFGYTSSYLDTCDKRLESLILKIKMSIDLNIYDCYFKVDIEELEEEYKKMKGGKVY